MSTKTATLTPATIARRKKALAATILAAAQEILDSRPEGEAKELYIAGIECGALVDAPVYESHKRGKNWFAVITEDPSAPSGLARKFLPSANGRFYYTLTEELQLGVAVEFGADYISGGGNRSRTRWYGVLVSITDSEANFLPCKTAVGAIRTAAKLVTPAKK